MYVRATHRGRNDRPADSVELLLVQPKNTPNMITVHPSITGAREQNTCRLFSDFRRNKNKDEIHYFPTFPRIQLSKNNLYNPHNYRTRDFAPARVPYELENNRKTQTKRFRWLNNLRPWAKWSTAIRYTSFVKSMTYGKTQSFQIVITWRIMQFEKRFVSSNKGEKKN